MEGMARGEGCAYSPIGEAPPLMSGKGHHGDELPNDGSTERLLHRSYSSISSPFSELYGRGHHQRSRNRCWAVGVKCMVVLSVCFVMVTTLCYKRTFEPTDQAFSITGNIPYRPHHGDLIQFLSERSKEESLSSRCLDSNVSSVSSTLHACRSAIASGVLAFTSAYVGSSPPSLWSAIDIFNRRGEVNVRPPDGDSSFFSQRSPNTSLRTFGAREVERRSQTLGRLVDLHSLVNANQSSVLGSYGKSQKTVSGGEAVASESSSELPLLGTERYTYFGFVPVYVTSLLTTASNPHASVHGTGEHEHAESSKAQGSEVTWSAPCFRDTRGKLTRKDNETYVISLSLNSPSSPFCLDSYFFASIEGFHTQAFYFRGNYSITWKMNATQTAAEAWDMQAKGIRVFRFIHDPIQTITDVYNTVSLFLEPLRNPGVDEKVAEKNVQFLRDYTKIKPFMSVRNQSVLEKEKYSTDLDESMIQSGDFLGIIRLDGLDPMLAWAMGSTTGHVTMALRPFANDSLYIVESTASDSYWPVNGIQMTPFKTWIEHARKADFNVVLAPLSAEYRKSFNTTKAFEFFQSVRGYDYGYQNMLWAWIDTVQQNYPCLPPDYEYCLTWHHLELVIAWVGKYHPHFWDLMFSQGLNRRVGTSGLPAADVFKEAARLNLSNGLLPTTVEDDGWIYNTSRFDKAAEGPSYVCCTFVCQMWKHGGIFDGVHRDINCNEFTNWDLYSLKIYDEQKTGPNRPEACKNADPDNQLCQLLGRYSLHLNDFNSREMVPHMAEACPGYPPDYIRPEGC